MRCVKQQQQQLLLRLLLAAAVALGSLSPLRPVSASPGGPSAALWSALQQQWHKWPWPSGGEDPLENCRQLSDCLYNHNDLGDSCIPTYCQPSVVLHGDGVWLPRTPFQGSRWVTSVHRDLFAEYSAWHFTFLEVAATAGAAKGFTEVIGFFNWKANNTGSYHGLSPTGRQSCSYGLLHFTTDKAGKVTDVTIWRAGFAEEREVLLKSPVYDDLISPLKAVTEQPFWIPSQSLQLKMVTHAHTLIEVLNQGEKFFDSLDDIAMDNVIFLDGMAIWGPPKAVGLTDLKLWLAGWLQQYDVNVAVTATTVTPTSNKVFVCFKMLLTSGSSAPAQVDGCLMYVFNIQGYITHIVLYRNGTPQEMADKFIGGAAAVSPAAWQQKRRQRRWQRDQKHRQQLGRTQHRAGRSEHTSTKQHESVA